VKNGFIIHEQYHHNNSETLYESDSMGKTATSAIVGIAVRKGLLDIDKPIHEYGVPADLANWSATGVDFFEQVTVRHLLSQASG
jgi:CubicO group peptidase (beta-lactamase class C family)